MAVGAVALSRAGAQAACGAQRAFGASTERASTRRSEPLRTTRRRVRCGLVEGGALPLRADQPAACWVLRATVLEAAGRQATDCTSTNGLVAPSSGCGPRYEPLSRAPFAPGVWRDCRPAKLAEFTDCRSDLSCIFKSTSCKQRDGADRGSSRSGFDQLGQAVAMASSDAGVGAGFCLAAGMTLT